VICWHIICQKISFVSEEHTASNFRLKNNPIKQPARSKQNSHHRLTSCFLVASKAYFLPWRWRQYFPQKHYWASTRLHCVISQKALLVVFAVARISDPIQQSNVVANLIAPHEARNEFFIVSITYSQPRKCAKVSHWNWALLALIAARSEWLYGLRHELSSLARRLGSCVRIPLKAWMTVCAFILFVLSCA
jgi:hypothetical protein